MALFPYKDDTPTYSYPYLTQLIIAVNIFFFLYPLLNGFLESLYPVYGFTTFGAFKRPQTIITSLFLHANLLHLLSNMWFLWLFGDNIEDRFGRFRFLTLYLLSGIAGNFSHALFTGFASNIPVIGASGAVAGVMGSYLVRFPGSRIRCIFLLIIYPIPIKIHAFWFLGFWMFFEFFNAIQFSGGHVAHWAHVGGFATGFIWALGRKDKSVKWKRVKL